MTVEFGPKVSNEGLVFAFDSASKFSYSGSGTNVRGLAEDKNAQLINGAVFNSNNNGYMFLDGSNDYIETDTITLNSNQISIDCFIKARGSITPQVLFEFSSNYTGVNNGFLVSYFDYVAGLDSDLLICRDGSGTDAKNIRAYQKEILYAGAWKHICVQFDESKVVSQRNILYANGEKQSPSQPQGNYDADNSAINFGSHKLFIGARDGGIGPFFGDIANLRVYNRLLSEDEVRSNYLAQKSRFGL